MGETSRSSSPAETTKRFRDVCLFSLPFPTPPDSAPFLARTDFVATDEDAQTVVVAHQGTDSHEILSIANDVQFTQVAANATLFPQAGAGVRLHSGFQDTQGRTADAVLSAVQGALADTGFARVLVTGHSLGAAVASLDAAMLRMALNESVAVDSVVFGLPRVGNQDWADLLDSLVSVGLCVVMIIVHPWVWARMWCWGHRGVMNAG